MRSTGPDPDEELMDPITDQPLVDPVVISTGFIIDRTTAFTEDGTMRLKACPWSRQPLSEQVYPIILHREKVLASSLLLHTTSH